MLSDQTIDRLRDILEDVRRVESFIDDMTLADFMADERTIFAVERHLQRITEAAVQIGSEDAARIGPVLPVAKMRALGNRLRHEYRDVDRAVIFDIARVEVPALEVEIATLLGSLAADGD